jgi:hypothetical protein
MRAAGLATRPHAGKLRFESGPKVHFRSQGHTVEVVTDDDPEEGTQ